MKKSKLDVSWIDGECWFNTAVTKRYNTRFIGIPVKKDICYPEGMLYKVTLNNLQEEYTRIFYKYQEAHEFFRSVRLADSIKDALNQVF